MNSSASCVADFMVSTIELTHTATPTLGSRFYPQNEARVSVESKAQVLSSDDQTRLDTFTNHMIDFLLDGSNNAIFQKLLKKTSL